MKSFFKKLAFVMALAMVVSSVAPAAASAAEEKEVIIVEQKGTEKVDEILFVEGDEPQDFRFLNAPANWRETYKWSVEDPTYATVDTAGVVTPVKAGTTKLQFSLEGKVVAEATIKVFAPAPKDEFKVEQVSDAKLKLTFTDELKLDPNKDFTLKLVIEVNGEEDQTKWPATFVADKTDKHVVWCYPFEEFTHGDEYVIYAGSDENYQRVETKIEAIDTLKLNTLTTEVNVNKLTKVVTPSFWASNGTVDLTAANLEDYIVKYDVKALDSEKYNEDHFHWDVNEETWELSVEIYEAGCSLTITAELVKDGEDDKVIDTAKTGVGAKVPTPWDFELKVVDWALVEVGEGFINWSKKSIPADKSSRGDWAVVIKFEDNEGKTYVTHPDAVQDNKKEGDPENIEIDGNDPISKAGYRFAFYSTDTDLMLVDEQTGALGVYVPGDIAFYVKATYTDEEDEKANFKKYIFAKEIEIKEATKLGSIAADKTSVSIVVDALDDNFESSEKVTMSAKDQHGEDWGNVAYSAYYYGKDGKKVDITTGINGKEITFSKASFDLNNISGTSVKVYIVGKTTVAFANEKDETTVTVKLVKPEYNKDGSIKIDENSRYKYQTYKTVLVENATADVKATATSATYTGDIVLYKTSDGGKLKIGVYTENDADGAFVAIQKEDQIKDLTEEGTRYVVMRTPDGEIVPLTWTNGKMQYTLNTVTGGLLTYAAEGAYTVEYVINRWHENGTREGDITGKATITVSNGAKKIEFKSAATGFSGDCYDENDEIDLKAVVYETFTWTLNDLPAVGHDAGKTHVVSVDAVVLGSSVIVKSVVLQIPVSTGVSVLQQVVLDRPVSLKHNPGLDK